MKRRRVVGDLKRGIACVRVDGHELDGLVLVCLCQLSEPRHVQIADRAGDTDEHQDDDVFGRRRLIEEVCELDRKSRPGIAQVKVGRSAVATEPLWDLAACWPGRECDAEDQYARRDPLYSSLSHQQSPSRFVIRSVHSPCE